MSIDGDIVLLGYPGDGHLHLITHSVIGRRSAQTILNYHLETIRTPADVIPGACQGILSIGHRRATVPAAPTAFRCERTAHGIDPGGHEPALPLGLPLLEYPVHFRGNVQDSSDAVIEKSLGSMLNYLSFLLGSNLKDNGSVQVNMSVDQAGDYIFPASVDGFCFRRS